MSGKALFRRAAGVLVALVVAASATVCGGIRAQTAADLHEVEVVGEGSDHEGALKAAFVKALQSTIGVVVHSSTTVRNFEVSEDIQRMLTNGCIEGYEELLSRTENGITRVAIRARVRRGIVADLLSRPGAQHPVEMKDEWARLSTGIRGREQAASMFREMSRELVPRLYRIKLIDLQTGAELESGANPLPMLQHVGDSVVHATWAVSIKPDLDFWDTQAAPLLGACLQALSERHGRLYIRMEGAIPDANFYSGGRQGFDGNFTRVPRRRWQRIPATGRLPWEGAAEVPVHQSAPHRIALQTNTRDATATALSIFYLSAESLRPLLADPSLEKLPLYLKARLQLKGGGEASTMAGQTSPILTPFGLPWTGAPDAKYLGPLFPVGWMAGGWSPKSAWPEWEGMVLPTSGVPGFDLFLIEDAKVQRGDGGYLDGVEKLMRVQRGKRFKDALCPFEFDTEVIVPIVFQMKVDDLRMIDGLKVEWVLDRSEIAARLK